MMKIALLVAMLGMAACSSVTPLPDVSGSMVRPLNPTKWDYQAALIEKQKEVGVTPSFAKQEDE